MNVWTVEVSFSFQLIYMPDRIPMPLTTWKIQRKAVQLLLYVWVRLSFSPEHTLVTVMKAAQPLCSMNVVPAEKYEISRLGLSAADLWSPCPGACYHTACFRICRHSLSFCGLDLPEQTGWDLPRPVTYFDRCRRDFLLKSLLLCHVTHSHG